MIARRFAATGTPTDCVMLGLRELVEGAQPDLVLSGVNRGANLAEDVTMSGTVAGAIEGMALGVPGIALSQTSWAPTIRPTTISASPNTSPRASCAKLVETGWSKRRDHQRQLPGRRARRRLRGRSDPPGLPRRPRPPSAEKRTDLRGKEYYWMGFRNEASKPAEGTDLRAVYEGRISVTPLHIDLTHMESVHNALKGVLGGAPPRLAKGLAAMVKKPHTDDVRVPSLMLALRSQGVSDPKVLGAIESTPREVFTPDLFKERAWEDSALPIACGQTISQPFIVGLMTQALNLEGRARACSRSAPAAGYQTTILSKLSRLVYTVERYRTLMRRGRGPVQNSLVSPM
jgi:5'-nucleotidase